MIEGARVEGRKPERRLLRVYRKEETEAWVQKMVGGLKWADMNYKSINSKGDQYFHAASSSSAFNKHYPTAS